MYPGQNSPKMRDLPNDLISFHSKPQQNFPFTEKNFTIQKLLKFYAKPHENLKIGIQKKKSDLLDQVL